MPCEHDDHRLGASPEHAPENDLGNCPIRSVGRWLFLRKIALIIGVFALLGGAFLGASWAQGAPEKGPPVTPAAAPSATAIVTPAAPPATPKVDASATAQAAPSAVPTTKDAPKEKVIAQHAVAAVSKVSDAIAQSFTKPLAQRLIVAAPPIVDVTAPRENVLALAIAAQIAGRLGENNRTHGDVTSLSGARALAQVQKVSALVYIAVEIAQGKLRVTADEYPVPKTVWAKIRAPEPPPISHAFAEAQIDAEVRSYLPAIPLTSAQTIRGKNFENDVVAITCGDLERDGNLEIAVVGRRRVTTSRLRAGKVEPLHGRAWTDLSPVHPTPVREPYAFATFVERGEGATAKTTLDVALSDRALSIRFDRDLVVESTFVGLAVPDGAGTACTRLTPSLVVTGPIGPCKKGDPAPLGPSVGGKYDAFASAALVDERGKPYVVWAGRENGVVELRDDAGHAAKFNGMGAQLAISDLDQDGSPEILGSVDTLVAADDAVLVRTWNRATNKVEERLKIPAAAGIRALGVCPADGPSHPPFVVATLDEIWVVR